MDNKNLTLLDVRAMIARTVNAAINTGGLEPLEVAMVMDSIKADLLIQVPYSALSETQKEPEEEDTDV